MTTPTFISSETSESTDAPPRTGPSPQPPAQGNSEELQLQEEEDLQMAIAISLNEQENKVCPLDFLGPLLAYYCMKLENENFNLLSSLEKENKFY